MRKITLMTFVAGTLATITAVAMTFAILIERPEPIPMDSDVFLAIDK